MAIVIIIVGFIAVFLLGGIIMLVMTALTIIGVPIIMIVEAVKQAGKK